MAQFIQANQLSPIQGSAGQFSPVVNQGPTLAEGLASVTNKVGGLIDTAGNIYGQNRAESLVEEEIEQIDRARKIAEEGKFTAGDAVPESLKLDQREWDMLSTAVQSGTMSREKARLIAGSRLRSRIAEEPFFADRMRQAASGVLGFNIESEGARQYFASFPTEADIASGSGNKILDEYRQQAEAWQALGITESVEGGMQFLAKADQLKMQDEVITLQAEAGVRSANDMASTLISNQNSLAWGSFLGDVKATEAETGQAIKPEEFTRKLRNSKQLFKESFDEKWIRAGGDLNSEDYNRHLARIDAEYQQMEEFANEFGIDNLMKLNVERQERLFDSMGMEMFPQLTLITRTFGQNVASDLINLAATNPTKRELLMSQNPELKSAFSLMQSDPKEFSRKMMGVTTKLINGEELTDEDTPWVNAAIPALMNGSPETQTATIESLADAGLDWKATSVLSEKSPRQVSQDNQDYFKKQYETAFEPLAQRFAEEIAANPNLTWSVSNDGMLSVSQDSAAGAMATPGPGGLMQNPQEVQGRIVAFNRAKQLADRMNEFAKGHKKGWSRIVGENLEQFKTRLSIAVEQAKVNADDRITAELSNNFLGMVESGSMDEARDYYENTLKPRNPQMYTASFDEIIRQAQAIANQGE